MIRFSLLPTAGSRTTISTRSNQLCSVRGGASRVSRSGNVPFRSKHFLKRPNKHAVSTSAVPVGEQHAGDTVLQRSFASPPAALSMSQVEELCRAAGRGDLDDVKKSVEQNGVPVNAREFFGRSALHYAVMDGWLEVVQYLLQKGASPLLSDRQGTTPLQEAQRARYKSQVHRDILKLLAQRPQTPSAEAAADQLGLRVGPEFFEALRKSLPLLCDRGGWDFGEALVPYEDSQILYPSGAVWIQESELERFHRMRKASEQLKYDPELNDFPARVARTKTTEWISDFTKLPAGFMSEQAKQIVTDAGVRSSMAVPVVNQGRTLAVLVFLSLKLRQFDRNLLEDFNSHCSRLIFGSVHADDHSAAVQQPLRSSDAELQTQIAEVQKHVMKESVFSEALIYQELDWYYNRLGLQQSYFRHFAPPQIAKHVHAFIASKKVAQMTNHIESLQFDFETHDGWFHLCPMLDSTQHEVEQKIREHILAVQRAARKKHEDAEKPRGDATSVRELESLPPVAYSLTFFRSEGVIAPNEPGSDVHLGLYISEQSEFVDPSPAPSERSVSRLCTRAFLAWAPPDIQQRYQDLMNRTLSTVFPVVDAFAADSTDSTVPLFFAYRTAAIGPYLNVMTQLLKVNNYIAKRKYINTFSNGVVIFSMYVTPRQGLKPEEKFCSIESLVEQASLLYHVNDAALTPLLQHSIELYAYSYCVANFIYYFVNTRSEEFVLLAEALRGDAVNIARLNMLQRTLRRDAITVARINECVLNPAHKAVLHELYEHFAAIEHSPSESTDTTGTKLLLQKIKKTVSSDLDEQILSWFAVFNTLVLKTNFWKTDKAAISFRLRTDFLQGQFPAVPFGVFYVVGADFRGFHIRFRDIARGGIRIVASRGKQVYRRNLDTLFAENYGLASTQQAKNKDLPEGGSKGVILLDSETANPTYGFRSYIDALLDLLVPTNSQDQRNKIVHWHPSASKEEEILFLGPDEGTAGYMDWAALHARTRGYRFWKAFTTGKSPSLGGIPHDLYGMTTRSIHKYVTELLKKVGKREEDCTKVQIGGPDGDLGSNEILISRDKTIAVVDKTGVLYDPAGLDRRELVRLAKARLNVESFDRQMLSREGFVVLVSQKEVTLPGGEQVESGLSFRNEFHLSKYCTADLFVPCGGRPESVNVRNVKQLLNANGSPRIKYVVEGANLFLTQDARLVLEKAGVILYKDASANKGGVTSSSLEVLASLAMSDEEHATHMQVREDGTIPRFYQTYVEQVQQRIEHNALLEFDCIWRENANTGTPRAVLTDQLSLKINELTDSIKIELWPSTPQAQRARVLTHACPPALVQLLGMDTIMRRVPSNYLQAMFGAHLASHYVYQHGLNANEMTFYQFMQQQLEKQPETSQ